MDVTVVVPVGPNPGNKKYLKECLDSVRAQTKSASEILVIDDMARLTQEEVGADVVLWKSPWRLGVAHAFNFGAMLAKNDLAVLLGSDDKLMPWCLEDAVKAYRKDGYYWFDVQYSDGRQQALPCNGAMVTKGFMRQSGGFPIEAEVGACDTMLMSILLKHPEAGTTYHVASSQPPYWYRVHDETDTGTRGPWQGVITQTRDILTRTWKRPAWTGG